MKHDDEEFRVMYREGPKGTPFHTLLVEGFVDGPVDVCKCYWQIVDFILKTLICWITFNLNVIDDHGHNSNLFVCRLVHFLGVWTL